MDPFSVFLANIVWLCGEHDASVTSWLRTPARNKQVGGHPQSQHLIGTAIDLVCDQEDDKQPLMEAARKLGLIAFDEGDHIHIQLHRKKNETAS